MPGKNHINYLPHGDAETRCCIVFVVDVMPGNLFKINSANAAFLQDTHLLPSDIKDAEIADIFNAGEAAFLRKQLVACVEMKQDTCYEHRSKTYVKKCPWVTQILPIPGEKQEIKKLLCISQEVALFEALHDDFNDGRTLLNRLFQIFPVPVIISDEKGFVVEWNEASAKLFGVENEDCRTINVTETPAIIEAIYWEDNTVRHPSQHTSSRALQQKTLIENDIMGIQLKAGNLLWLSVSSMHLNLPGYGVATTYCDISSQKKRAENTLISKKRLEAILNNSPDTILLVDYDLKIVACNKAAEKHMERYYGRPLQVGGLMFEMYLTDKRKQLMLQHFSEVQRTQKEVFVEHYLVYPDGEEKWFNRKYYPAYDKEKKHIGYVINSTDITAQKRREQRIKQQNNQLMEIAKIQSEELAEPLLIFLKQLKLLMSQAASSLDNELLTTLQLSADQLKELIVSKFAFTG